MTTAHDGPLFQERLLEWYPGQSMSFSGDPLEIRIDDETPEDNSYGFCTIQIKVHNSADGTFTLRVKNVPCDNEAEGVIKSFGGAWTEDRLGKSFSITLTVDSVSKIKIIARKIRSVVGRGKKYLNPNWKWMAPRTAKSLEHFAIKLSSFCRESNKRPRLASTKPK